MEVTYGSEFGVGNLVHIPSLGGGSVLEFESLINGLVIDLVGLDEIRSNVCAACRVSQIE